jgi:ABC-type branched-subunit amino acid transport system substrate-binding protein
MILVPNRLLQLNGNKLLILIFIFFLAACSKKTAPVAEVPKKPAPEKSEPAKAEEPKVVAPHSLALLLPFNLDKINIKAADLKDIKKADLAIEFYQGFKLALDSLSSEGYNFKLQLFDSQEDELQIVNLARAKSVLTNDLIIGPIFPESIKTFSEFADLGNKLQVSPLAASDPAQFKNSKLVSLTNHIDQHSRKVADFINLNYKPANVQVVLINTRSNDDEKFAGPFKEFLQKLSNGSFEIIERPNSIGLEEYLSTSKINLVIISSDKRDFVLPTIDRLYKVSQAGSKIEVFGHPNWVKAQFLNPEKMQWLNTRVTSSYYVNYKSKKVKSFVARYRDEFGSDPSEFSFKGFDTGYFFGKLLARYGNQYTSHLTDSEYEGLHNKFRFVHDKTSGYLNDELLMLKYQGFELQLEK